MKNYSPSSFGAYGRTYPFRPLSFSRLNCFFLCFPLGFLVKATIAKIILIKPIKFYDLISIISKRGFHSPSSSLSNEIKL